MMRSGIRQYGKLPVWIVENHNEVLEPIYRAIASRHLAFERIAMLHFDSHPDLQIDTQMPADTVFNKEELLDSLSIENWIMPAIYAGHLGHVTWVKPPWADQLPEGSRMVRVGRHKALGKLRINWPESYFLSDVLYAPAEELEDGKDAEINVVTMETPCLRTCDFSNTGSVHSSDGASCAKPNSSVSGMRCVDAICSGCGANFEDQRPSSLRTDKNQFDDGHCAMTSPVNSQGTHTCITSHANAQDCDRGKDQVSLEERGARTNSRDSHEYINHSGANLRSCSEHMNRIAENPASLGNTDCEQQQRVAECSPHGESETTGQTKCNCGIANLESRAGSSKEHEAKISAPMTLDDVAQQFSDFQGRFILDIDLDFFSTRNPFKQMYSKEQYRLLEELYQLAAPIDESASALQTYQKQRAEQISALAAGLRAAFNGEDYEASFGNRQRFLQIVTLVESLKSTSGIEEECLDPEMVHMAGLTCDDSGELPHHVSTDEEIESLVSSMERLLERMPAPTMVTISRSSHDDYCPTHQVDGIQRRVLAMLQSLYKTLDVHIEYETV